MGVCFPTPFSHRRILRVASRPSHTGIWMSISTASNLSLCTASTASCPFPATVQVCPHFLSTAVATFWFTRLSSTTRSFREVQEGGSGESVGQAAWVPIPLLGGAAPHSCGHTGWGKEG